MPAAQAARRGQQGVEVGIGLGPNETQRIDPHVARGPDAFVARTSFSASVTIGRVLRWDGSSGVRLDLDRRRGLRTVGESSGRTSLPGVAVRASALAAW